MKSLRLSSYAALLMLALFAWSCQNDDNDFNIEDTRTASEFSADVPLAWYALFEEIDRYAPGYRPPAAARALGYIGLAGYEAVVAGMPKYNSMQNQFSSLSLPAVEPNKEYHWPTAANAAYAAMLRYFYPHIDQQFITRIDALENELQTKASGQASLEIISRSAKYGKAVAKAVYDWSKTDAAGHEAYLNPRPTSYIPPSGPGLWKPTSPDFTPALFPYWGQVRTFGMKQNDLLAKPPLPWSEDPNSPFYNQAKEVKIWVDEIRAGQDEEGHWIAEFWSDDFFQVTFTPPGRWIAIANQVVKKEKPSLETAVELYAKMGMALTDAAIAVWYSKYYYNLERPVDFIRRNFDSNWESIMNHPFTGITGINPEFPAYPSGHSGFGGAGATILTDIFGYNYKMIDKCHEGRTEFRGTPRSFNTFIDMAVENAYSRLPIGVHYRMDCDEGLRQGYLAGQRTLELPWKK